jgi:hypothetical protein
MNDLRIALQIETAAMCGFNIIPQHNLLSGVPTVQILRSERIVDSWSALQATSKFVVRGPTWTLSWGPSPDEAYGEGERRLDRSRELQFCRAPLSVPTPFEPFDRLRKCTNC